MLEKIIILYLAAISLISVIVCIYDKVISKKNRIELRIPEKTLLGIGFLGGAAGALLGMNLFRHKTKHWYFWAVNLLGLAWQIALLIYLQF